jgi:rhodanese-related sulfurtransferase
LEGARGHTEATRHEGEIILPSGLGTQTTLAAATLRTLGFRHAAALDGGVKDWREKGLPLTGGE